MNIPLSVVLPTKDRLALLQCTLACILPQLQSGDEILVLVDGPQDESYKYLSSLNSDQVRLIQPEGKLGGFSHYRLLFETARNDCIIMVHDDELYHGKLLASARSVFAENTSVTFINTGQLVVWAGKNLVVQKNISFTQNKMIEGRNWASKEIHQGMRFNCSCLIFRRDPDSLTVLTRTQISADNLFTALLGAKGDVYECPFFGSTWLLHSGNTSRRDYLKPDHSALWQAWLDLKRHGLLGFVDDKAIAAQRSAASRIYAWNAFAAAAVDGNKIGFNECIRQIHLAEGASIRYLLLRAAVLPGMWKGFIIFSRLAKRFTPKGRSSQQSGDTDPQEIASLLCLSEPIVTNWRAIAQTSGR